jgi:four helix bundle protein
MQQLDHERLDVYQLALDFLVFANGVIEALPRGRSHLADQLTRASTSIVLNVAEAPASSPSRTSAATT